MTKVSCPSCGAQVDLRHPSSVMAVCSYCHTLVAKEADAVKNLGKISEVLEDFSPLQLGTTGQFERRPFTLIGRIQLRYDRGMWSEWYLCFDDGTTGWLSDFNGLYVVTQRQSTPVDAPAFEDVQPLQTLDYLARTWTATDVRAAQCVGGEGELPFQVGKGWTARQVDYRHGNRFLTLDYTESTPPTAYFGNTLIASELFLSHTRTPENILQTSGRYKGQMQALSCPSCGAGLKFRAGMATHVVCGTCQSSVDCSGDRAIVLEAAHQLEVMEQRIALKLGQDVKLEGSSYEVSGVMQRGAPGSPPQERWLEYLLVSKDSLVWLIQSHDQEWTLYRPVTSWPDFSKDQKKIATTYGLFSFQESSVVETHYAIGAFNWRVHVGDRVTVQEYRQDHRSISLEFDNHEAVISQGGALTPEEAVELLGLQSPDATQARNEPPQRARPSSSTDHNQSFLGSNDSGESNYGFGKNNLGLIAFWYLVYLAITIAKSIYLGLSYGADEFSDAWYLLGLVLVLHLKFGSLPVLALSKKDNMLLRGFWRMNFHVLSLVGLACIAFWDHRTTGSDNDTAYYNAQGSSSTYSSRGGHK